MNDLVRVTELMESTHVAEHLPQRVEPHWLDYLDLRSHEKPLLELINLGLNKATLDQIVSAVENGRSIRPIRPESQEANAYLAKILREEVQKQFSEGNRPLVELILNGIDARPRDYEGIYVVDVNVDKSSFEVTDNGKGMNLQRILDTLIIPFSTDKNELVDIGRFGIGFFSDLQYCLQRPKYARVTVNTGDGRSSYELEVYSIGEDVEQLISSLRKIRAKQAGTTVKVSGIKLDPKETTEYLSRYLGFFDPRRAVIRVNGVPVNLMRRSSPAYSEYLIPTELGYRGSPVTQNVRVAIDVLSDRGDSHINLYSQGVFIQRHELRYGRLDIDFPSAVPLVEGRDELKRNDAYWKGLGESLKAIIRYGEEHQDNLWVLMNLREMLPAFINRLRESDEGIGREIARVCFPERTYLVHDTDGMGMTVSLKDFFGEDIAGQLYVPKTNTYYHAWKDILPGVHQLVEDNVTRRTHVRDRGCLEKKMQQKLGRNLPNFQELDWDSIIYFVSLRNPAETRSPVLCVNGDTYVNVGHPFMQSVGYTQRYGVRTAMLREKMGEKAMEDRIIR